MNWTKKFSIVGIGINENLIEKYPQYFFDGLHIHILDCSLIQNKQLSYIKSPLSEDGVLYQWGISKQLTEKTRYPCVSENERMNYGNIGIGSAARGGYENNNQYCGGGEGFIWNESAYRVTKGGNAFSLSNNDQYWFVQTCNFNNHYSMESMLFNGSHEELNSILKKDICINYCAYITTFECYIQQECFLARSNGIYKDDNVIERELSLFESDKYTDGGHLLEINNKMVLNIVSPILIKPLSKIHILTENIRIES